MAFWIFEYAPQGVDEIAGNDDAKAAVKKWALDWTRGKKQKPLLLHGPSGVGKTALAYAIAKEFGWLLVESGSSEVRTEQSLQKRFGGGFSEGLFGKRLLLVDDLDSVFDRGEVPALMELLLNAAQPMVLCANDVWNPKLAKLRNECVKVELKKINKTAVKSVLSKIALKEKIPDAEKTIAEIANACNGDLRSAIIDLQAGFISEREREEDVFKNLVAVFKGSFNEALKVDPGDFDLFLRWVEENIPAEYEKKDDVAKAFDWFSKADVFNGRISSRQDYGLKKYVRALALGGVAAAKKEPYRKFSSYSFPSVIRSLSASKAERQMLKQISLKAASQMHCSSKDALVSLVLLAPESWRELALSEDEQGFLKEWLKGRA